MTTVPLDSPSLVGWERIPVAGSYHAGDPAFQAKLNELEDWPNPIQVVAMDENTITIWELREPGKWPVGEV